MKIQRLVDPRTDREKELDAAFWEFHESNLWVYDYIVMLCRDARARGKKRVGVQLLLNVVRWEAEMRTESDDGFRINQNHSSRYARLVLHRERDLDGIFSTRACGADNFDPRGPR